MSSERPGVEFTARTVEEAIERGLHELGVAREEVQVEVLHPGRGGLLGLGAHDAHVRLTQLVATVPSSSPCARVAPEAGKGTVEPSGERGGGSEEEGALLTTPSSLLSTSYETTEVAVGLLQGLIDRMGVQGTVVARASGELVEEGETPALVLDIMGRDLGVLIGRQAETLQAMQYLMRLMLSKSLARWEPVVVDVESYRARRRRSLRRLAEHMAERAVSSRRRVILEAMPAQERRIIHLALQKHPGVTTNSIGEGDHRKVTIVPQ